MTKIKICGITKLEEVDALNIVMPDYIGFVFAESKRKISKVIAKEIIRKLDPGIKVVGVFKDNEKNEIEEILNYLNLKIVQLHGYKRLDLGNVEIWQGINIENSMVDEKELYGDILVLDGKTSGEGQRWNLDIIKDKRISNKYFVAGGVNPDNVIEILTKSKAYGVDVSSGVENKVGGNLKKDNILIKKLIERVREYDKREV